MTVWAGVDIGNATTEIILATGGQPLTVIASGRTPTRGGKGSLRAVEGAAQLAHRLAKSHGVTIDRAAFAPTRPVTATVDRQQLERPATGRLAVATRSADTTAGDGAGVGVPVHVDRLDTITSDRPAVVCAPHDWSYRQVAPVVEEAISSGLPIVAVLTANDEAVLISNRLSTSLPVVDCVDVPVLLSADLVAVEVRHGSAPLRQLTDPFWLVNAFELHEDERGDARIVADQLFDSACAVVALGGQLTRQAPPPVLPIPAPEDPRRLHVVNLADIAADAGSRRGSVETAASVCASLDTGGPEPADGATLAEALGVPVVQVDSEAEAARVGALTTPGVSHDAHVVDVGGGTIDVVSAQDRVVLPGAGQMLTAATSAALGISRSAAEYAKRSEALRAVTSQLVEDEHGRRSFLDVPLDGRSTGWLLAAAPTGLLPFSSQLSTSEWRSWRLAAKRHIIGSRVLTGLELADIRATDVVLVGGGAGDDELVRAVSEQMGFGVSVGQGNIAGQLGHRFAVAYGLIVLSGR